MMNEQEKTFLVCVLVFVFIGMTLIVLSETCQGDEMIESAWWRQDTLLSGKSGDLGLLCLLLHVLIHLRVRCHDSLCLVLISRHLFMKWLTPNK